MKEKLTNYLTSKHAVMFGTESENNKQEQINFLLTLLRKKNLTLTSVAIIVVILTSKTIMLQFLKMLG